MDASSMWSYPGTWAGLGIMVVLLGGIALFAYALRRTLRSPPIDEQPSTLPPRTDSENDTPP
ncbi:hypothetical protein [Simplicispira psychrophila]|uniref:hypothetical protein n=1 Tax=Simplicispira psychrophila TaxID=80882 RepID=UPI0012EBB74A|nr:hypothetical protein [Simplicispira psychrophila]